MKKDLQRALGRAQSTAADVARLIGVIDAALLETSEQSAPIANDARQDRVSPQQLQCFWILSENKALNKKKYLSVNDIVGQLSRVTTASGQNQARASRVPVYLGRAADSGHIHLNEKGDVTLLGKGADHLRRRQHELEPT